MSRPSATDGLAASLEQALRERGTPERALQEQAYLKSSLAFLGTSVPDTRRVVRGFVQGHPELNAEEIRRLAVQLWQAPVFERRVGGGRGLLGSPGSAPFTARAAAAGRR